LSCNQLLIAQQNIQAIAVDMWDNGDNAIDNYDFFCEIMGERTLTEEDEEFAMELLMEHFDDLTVMIGRSEVNIQKILDVFDVVQVSMVTGTSKARSD